MTNLLQVFLRFYRHFPDLLVSGLNQVDKQMRRERERQLNRTRLCYRTPIRSTSHLKENLPRIRFKSDFRTWKNPEAGKVSQEARSPCASQW